MQPFEHENWIAGSWRPSSSGVGFELAAHVPPYAAIGRWPRSTADDARDAVAAGSQAASAWQRTPRSERERILARLPEELERQDLGPSLAAALGLHASELEPRLQHDLHDLRVALELARESSPESGGGVFQAHWSDLVGGLAGRLAARLVAGRTAVLLSDPRLPQAAEAVARALEASALPTGVLSLVHDDSETAIAATLALPGLAWARLKGVEQRILRLWERAREPDALAWSMWPVASRSHLVLSSGDPASEAALVVEQAFGRSATLSGQFPGQIGRVLCHQRLFSRFSEELLTRLEDSPDARAPVPAIEADLFEHVRGAWALGLDEGATPIFGGEPWRAQQAESPSESPGVSPARAPRGVPPAVFTNVESHQRLVRLRRPAPLLALLRVSSDEAGRELLLELDAPRPSAARGSDT